MKTLLETPRDLASRLAARVDDVCRELLPNGKRDGHEWRVGSPDGEKGRSMGVHLAGEKAGVWCDFASGQNGDLLDLWVAVRKVSMGEAMGQVRGFLGLSQPRLERKAQTFTRPKRPTCTAPKSAVRDYLAARGLTDASLKAYGVGERGDMIVFPFMRDGELVLAKERQAVDGAKPKPTESGCEKIAFGWQAIPKDSREVIITEGEIDALSSWEMGYPALSVPFGGGGGNKQDWVENDFDSLARFDVIYLAMESDEEGNLCAQELAQRLGPERCRRVRIPEGFKDANDLLRGGYGGEDWGAIIRNAQSLDPTELRKASDYTDAIIREFYPPEGGDGGFKTPWRSFNEEFRFRRGEVALLQGINGHGKTELAGNIVADVISNGQRACIASMEFKPAKWLKRLCRQVAGIEHPTEKYIREVAAWWDSFLWVFDVTGKAKADRILSVFEYAARRYQIKFFVIDNLAKCGFAEDDYNRQKDFVDQLTDMARELDVFLLLICHPKKTEDESRQPGKMDVKGTGAITDMVDSVLSIWRNKPKHDKLRKLKDGPEREEVAGQPDAILKCHKQRNGETEPVVALWFHQPSHQFVPAPGLGPLTYVHSRERAAA